MATHGPKKLGDILGYVAAKYGFAQTTTKNELETIWNEVAGDRYRSGTRVGPLRRGTLEIGVQNGLLLQELEGFQKAMLLKQLQERTRNVTVKALKFKRI